MKHLKLYIILISILCSIQSEAQFYVTGDDPGRLQWQTFDTEGYRIIYPQGNDSLARVYGEKLERYRIPVSRSVGYLPGGGFSSRMPVVLHTYNDANGSVAWAPKRMDLFTIPSAYGPEPLPWSTMLAVHESRHVAQMQFGMTKAQKPFNFLFGQMWNILVSILYPGISAIEGDAVIAETALTRSGRGRTADFLNYYRVAFDNGDFRKWGRWRFVSQKHYSPDYYALGYLTIGGIRYLYDCPMYMSEAYHLAARQPYRLGAFYKTLSDLTGRRFNDAFMEVCDTMNTLWRADAEARAPFIPSEQISREPELYTDYTDNLIIDGNIFSIKSGHTTVPVLVRMDSSGKEDHISYFASGTGRLNYSSLTGKLYWSETQLDKRWSLQTVSRLRMMDPWGGKKEDITDTGLLFNPSPSTHHLAATEYHPEGCSSLTIMDIEDRCSTVSLNAPDSLQIVETAWIGDSVFATAVSDNGYGIYCLHLNPENLKESIWETSLSPQPVMIKDFRSYGNELIFTCDRTGVNELYHFDPSTGDLRQKTCTRYGASDFNYDGNSEYLYYSSQTLKGMMIFRTPVDSLINRKVDFKDLPQYHIATKITAQEKALAEKEKTEESSQSGFSEPARYRKSTHAFNIHSWVPAYVSVDKIMNMSFDHIWQAASPGLTGIMQNNLATGVGEFGYSAHKDPYNPAVWRHSGHARFTYSGMYPVFEAHVDINDRDARQYNVRQYLLPENSAGAEITSAPLEGTPSIQGGLSIYIPFSFSSGGWFKGLVPEISYSVSNDRFNTAMILMSLDEKDSVIPGFPVFTGITDGRNRIMHSLSGSIRGYAMLGTPSSAVYPRWGIGGEIGASSSLSYHDYISPMGYVYGYGYIPGLTDTQGLKLTAILQKSLTDKAIFNQQITSILPRGLSYNASLGSWLSTRYDSLVKLTADYAVPIYIGDITLGGSFFAVKRLILSPHFDYSFIGNKGIWSAGSELILDMHSILTLEWPCQLGITYSYNGGTGDFLENITKQSGSVLKRHSVDFVFNVSF